MADRPTVPLLVARRASPRFTVPYRAAALLGIGSHVGFLGLFAALGVPALMYFNLASIAVFVLVYALVARQATKLALGLAMAEIAAHQALAVHCVGWDAGFQYYLLGVGPLPLLLPGAPRLVRVGVPLALLALFGYLLVAYLGAPPPYEIDGTWLALMQLGNLLGAFFLVWGFAYFYQKGAELAEGALVEERARSEQLLHNILPPSVVERLRSKPGVVADAFEDTSILFADLVGFTPLAARCTPEELVRLLDEIVVAFDELVEARGLEKVKTIGDAYMVAAGVPSRRADHAEALAELALAMRARFAGIAKASPSPLAMRIGIHSGPVVAGVIGKSKFAYDLWGDTVNTAARMESHGEPDKVHVSEATVRALGEGWSLEERGTVEIKGKGAMRTYFLLGRAEAVGERVAIA
ncbi:MAG: hypothetical protein M5U28_22630 [Sandaracinaceae bacterium]|nr:hypothetical protein [Sandaracinaceae bacterium]